MMMRNEISDVLAFIASLQIPNHAISLSSFDVFLLIRIFAGLTGLLLVVVNYTMVDDPIPGWLVFLSALCTPIIAIFFWVDLPHFLTLSIGLCSLLYVSAGLAVGRFIRTLIRKPLIGLIGLVLYGALAAVLYFYRREWFYWIYFVLQGILIAIAWYEKSDERSVLLFLPIAAGAFLLLSMMSIKAAEVDAIYHNIDWATANIGISRHIIIASYYVGRVLRKYGFILGITISIIKALPDIALLIG